MSSALIAWKGLVFPRLGFLPFINSILIPYAVVVLYAWTRECVLVTTIRMP